MQKMKYLIKLGLLLLPILFVTGGCFSQDADKVSPKAINKSLKETSLIDKNADNAADKAPTPAYGKIVNTDASTNNLMNAGCVANDGATTYFTVRYSQDGSVYKLAAGRKIPEAFSNETASQLVVAGDYIFTTNVYNYREPFTMRKMKTDGSEAHIICQDDRQRFVVYNDGKWIYYYMLEIIVCQADKPAPGEEPRTYDYSTLYKMKVDGSSTQQVLDYIYANGLPYISDGWIYYSCQPPDWAIEQEKLTGLERGFFKIKLDGTGKTKLLDNLPFSAVVKQGDWLFYSGDGLFKLKTDGSENIKLCDDHAATVNVKNEWVYFTSFGDQISLNRIDWEGHNRQKLSQVDRVQDISISGDWVYFHADEGDKMQLYRIKPDGTGQEKLK